MHPETPAEIFLHERLLIHNAIGVYLRTGLRVNDFTPAMLRNMAGKFTGKAYPQSRKGLEAAYRDLSELVD